MRLSQNRPGGRRRGRGVLPGAPAPVPALRRPHELVELREPGHVEVDGRDVAVADLQLPVSALGDVPRGVRGGREARPRLALDHLDAVQAPAGGRKVAREEVDVASPLGAGHHVGQGVEHGHQPHPRLVRGLEGDRPICADVPEPLLVWAVVGQGHRLEGAPPLAADVGCRLQLRAELVQREAVRVVVDAPHAGPRALAQLLLGVQELGDEEEVLGRGPGGRRPGLRDLRQGRRALEEAVEVHGHDPLAELAELLEADPPV
mmetsp:Transcript_73385/g.228195  ORF Transcript_73385/g.228195 Transcript_73385/m.228195 type:complete len:261 (-) Transcript_73385:278-1060(-)